MTDDSKMYVFVQVKSKSNNEIDAMIKIAEIQDSLTIVYFKDKTKKELREVVFDLIIKSKPKISIEVDKKGEEWISKKPTNIVIVKDNKFTNKELRMFDDLIHYKDVTFSFVSKKEYPYLLDFLYTLATIRTGYKGRLKQFPEYLNEPHELIKDERIKK